MPNDEQDISNCPNALSIQDPDLCLDKRMDQCPKTTDATKA